MPGFLFDTNVLIQYLRDGPDSIAIDAIIRASEIGNVLLSRVSIFELWAPDKWKISEKSTSLIPRWVRKLDAGDLPLGIGEIVEDEVEEHHLELPVAPQIEVIHRNRYWVITDESRRTFLQIQHQDGTLTISSPDRRREEIQSDIEQIYGLVEEYNVQILGISKTSQAFAEVILKYHYRTLGKNAITDALIIGAGMARRAWLITHEIQRWCIIAADLQRRSISIPPIKVATPEMILQRAKSYFRGSRGCSNE